MRGELAAYGAGLERLPELVVLSKRDLVPPSEVEAAVAEWRERLGDGVLGVLGVSSATGEGWTSCGGDPRRAARGAARPAGDGRRAARRRAEFEAEHRVYRPGGEGGFGVEREGDGGFRVLGRGVELLFERHDLANEEALDYLERRLREIGVIAAFRAPASSAATRCASASTSSSYDPDAPRARPRGCSGRPSRTSAWRAGRR